MEFIKCKMIHSRLLLIAVLHSISLQWVIIIIIIYIVMIYTWRVKFSAIVHWPRIIIFFLLCYILSCHGTLIFSLTYNLLFSDIFEHNILQQSNKSINFDFDQQQQVQKPNSCYPNQTTTERRINIGVSWSWWSRSWLRCKYPVFILS